MKHSNKVLIAKTHIQNLGFESIVLSLQGLKNVWYPSSLMIKSWDFYRRLIGVETTSCVYKVLPIGYQKAGIGATCCYLGSNFLAFLADCLRLSTFEPKINIISKQPEVKMKNWVAYKNKTWKNTFQKRLSSKLDCFSIALSKNCCRKEL